MTERPTVSVVIPCYNASRYLRETLESTLNQTCPPLEVLLIDDGSTDDSGAIAASYGPPVRVIRQENQGESAARNRGMDEARGDWIGLLDADDRWLPRKLERQLGSLDGAARDAVCIYSDFYVFGSVRRTLVQCPPWPEPDECRYRMLTDPFISLSDVLIRKDVARQVRFPTDIRYGEERVFWTRFSRLGSGVHVPEALSEYRKHATQQTSQSNHGYRVIAALWKWISEHPEEFTARENERLRQWCMQNIVFRHDHAYWRNDRTVVEQTRALYRELAPAGGPSPALFSRGSPSLALRAAYHTWNSALDALPQRLRQALIRISRRAVDRVKRGGAER